jgi:nucleoid-associated protein YgaU
LTATVVVALVLLVAFRHPITRVIGTAGPEVPALTASAGTRVSAPAAVMPRAVEGAALVRLHAPRDPFAPESTAAATAAKSVTQQLAATGSTASYRVRPGDSLWSIARRNPAGSQSAAAINTRWHQIYAANRAAVGANPAVLRVGVVLRIPAVAT